MMAENAKNRLQIRCQQDRLALPTYITFRNGGSDHAPIWVSAVNVGDVSAKGSVAVTKIQAEMSAAEIFLSSYDTKRPIKDSDAVMSRVNLPRTVLLIDGENMHKFAESLSEDILNNVDVRLYIGEHHSLAEKEYDQRVIKIICKGFRKDLVDTCIQMQVARFLTQKHYDRYWIATRDHFAFTVVDLIGSSDMGWNAASGKVVTQVSHCVL
ncbi:Hypothetical protein POVR1_LOCUS204 [uncultured virus]|nr:Hypothetical protein POVR1_LOCUS204 [uncultured virus]